MKAAKKNRKARKQAGVSGSVNAYVNSGANINTRANDRQISDAAIAAHSVDQSEQKIKASDYGFDQLGQAGIAGSDVKQSPQDQANVTRTAPVGHVIELEPHYRTRYGAWCGIIILWLASLAAVLLRGDAPEWLLLSTISLLIVISGVWPWLGAYRISYQRSMTELMIEQGELLLSISLKRRLPLPGVWYAIDDRLHNRSTMRDHRLKLRTGFMPLFHRSMSLTYRISDIERGCYEAEPTIIRVGDWLGLTCIKVEQLQQAKLIVLPRLVEPEEESFVARHTSSKWLRKKIEHPYRNTYISSTQHSEERYEGASGIKAHDRMDELGATTRPYKAGDSYRKIDQRAAARGRGLHTRIGEGEISEPKLCMMIDQYDLPYREEQQDQMFSSLISWCLADTVEAGKQQNVTVLSDNWSFEYTSEQDVAELKYLLATTRPDVEMHMKDRVSYMSMLLPTAGHIVVYSGAWKDSEGWLALAELAMVKGSRLELQFVTTNRVMTYAMREQQKIMEQAGIQIVWRYSCDAPEPVIEVEKGSERYVSRA